VSSSFLWKIASHTYTERSVNDLFDNKHGGTLRPGLSQKGSSDRLSLQMIEHKTLWKLQSKIINRVTRRRQPSRVIVCVAIWVGIINLLNTNNNNNISNISNVNNDNNDNNEGQGDELRPPQMSNVMALIDVCSILGPFLWSY